MIKKINKSVVPIKQILLNKMGGEREAKEFGSIMVTGISKIHNYMKTKFVRMVRKLI